MGAITLDWNRVEKVLNEEKKGDSDELHSKSRWTERNQLKTDTINWKDLGQRP